MLALHRKMLEAILFMAAWSCYSGKHWYPYSMHNLYF